MYLRSDFNVLSALNGSGEELLHLRVALLHHHSFPLFVSLNTASLALRRSILSLAAQESEGEENSQKRNMSFLFHVVVFVVLNAKLRHVHSIHEAEKIKGKVSHRGIEVSINRPIPIRVAFSGYSSHSFPYSLTFSSVPSVIIHNFV